MKKKLYRNEEEAVVCGVCAGVADYFGKDIELMRLVWISLILFAGVSIWLYIVAAIIIPAKSKIDEHVTLDEDFEI